MNDKYVKLADVKRKLRYIFKVYGVNGFVKEKISRALNNLPYSVKGDLETTLEAADVQPVAHAKWIGFTRSAFRGCDYTGEPIFRDTTVWKCSHCGRNTVVRDNFCPNCGARMDGDNNG